MKLKTVYLVLCALGAVLPLWQLWPWLAANGLDVYMRERELERRTAEG